MLFTPLSEIPITTNNLIFLQKCRMSGFKNIYYSTFLGVFLQGSQNDSNTNILSTTNLNTYPDVSLAGEVIVINLFWNDVILCIGTLQFTHNLTSSTYLSNTLRRSLIKDSTNFVFRDVLLDLQILPSENKNSWYHYKKKGKTLQTQPPQTHTHFYASVLTLHNTHLKFNVLPPFNPRFPISATMSL